MSVRYHISRKVGTILYGRTISLFFAAASLITSALFTGYDLAGQRPTPQTPQPVVNVTETQPPPTTLPPVVPVTEAPQPDHGEILRQQYAQATRNINGSHFFIYDPQTYRMIYSNTEPADKLYPASITKLYTAYLALQYLDPDTVITAGDELALVQPGSSTAFIARGHRLRVDMLVEAMLLPSGNDAAYVLAAAAGRVIAGQSQLSGKEAVAAFVSEMNQEAFRMGMVNSNLTNPDGFHDEYHFSCPQDVAIFASLAMAEPVVAGYAKLCADAVTFESGQVITWYNTNRLVNPKSDSYCPNAIGAKTGYTTEAGYCLLAAFQEDERQLIIGIFGSNQPYDRYDDAIQLWELCK